MEVERLGKDASATRSDVQAMLMQSSELRQEVENMRSSKNTDFVAVTTCKRDSDARVDKCESACDLKVRQSDSACESKVKECESKVGSAQRELRSSQQSCSERLAKAKETCEARAASSGMFQWVAPEVGIWPGGFSLVWFKRVVWSLPSLLVFVHSVTFELKRTGFTSDFLGALIVLGVSGGLVTAGFVWGMSERSIVFLLFPLALLGSLYNRFYIHTDRDRVSFRDVVVYFFFPLSQNALLSPRSFFCATGSGPREFRSHTPNCP
jgi:hypothetical protein